MVRTCCKRVFLEPNGGSSIVRCDKLAIVRASFGPTCGERRRTRTRLARHLGSPPDSGVPALADRPHATANVVCGELVTPYRIPQSAKLTQSHAVTASPPYRSEHPLEQFERETHDVGLTSFQDPDPGQTVLVPKCTCLALPGVGRQILVQCPIGNVIHDQSSDVHLNAGSIFRSHPNA